MLHRLSRLASLPGVLTYFLLAGCASVGSQSPTYVEDPKAKSQEPCQTQAQGSQDKTTKDPCKKTQP
jgi:hypothetical protein